MKIQEVNSQPFVVYKDSTWMLFNISSRVKFKPTEQGYKYLTASHNATQKAINPSSKSITVDYFKSQADENGYIEMSMLDFLYKIGVMPKADDYIEKDILISQRAVNIYEGESNTYLDDIDR